MVDEKQVIFYSEKYAKKAKADREKTLAKAIDMMQNPSKYSRATSYGAAGYVKNITFDEETGEILSPQKLMELDLESIFPKEYVLLVK